MNFLISVKLCLTFINYLIHFLVLTMNSGQNLEEPSFVQKIHYELYKKIIDSLKNIVYSAHLNLGHICTLINFLFERIKIHRLKKKEFNFKNNRI